MKKAVYYILLAVFIGVFLFAAYQIGSYMLEKHKSDEVLKDAGKYVYIPDLSSDEEPEGEPEQVYVDFAALEGGSGVEGKKRGFRLLAVYSGYHDQL